jgi:hypothetical protein
MMTNPLAVPRPTPDQTEQWFQTVSRYVANKRPCYNADGTLNDPSGKLGILQQKIKYVLLIKGVTPMLVGDFLVGKMSGPGQEPTTTPGGLSYDAAWEKVNSSHGQLNADLDTHFVSGAEWHSPGTAGTVTPATPNAPAAPDSMGFTRDSDEIIRRLHLSPPIGWDGTPMCQLGAWVGGLQQASFSSFVTAQNSGDWVGTPSVTVELALTWQTVRGNPQIRGDAAVRTWDGPITPAEIKGMSPADFVNHFDPPTGSPSGNTP